MPPEPVSDQSTVTNDSAQQQPPKVVNDGTDCTHEVKVTPAEPKSPKTDDVDLLSSEQKGDIEEAEKQDDTPQVEVSVDASRNADYNFPQDEPVPEDEVEEEIPAKPLEEEMPVKPVALVPTGSKKKS